MGTAKFGLAPPRIEINVVTLRFISSLLDSSSALESVLIVVLPMGREIEMVGVTVCHYFPVNRSK